MVFPDIEEQSMLAAKTGAKAKTVMKEFRKTAVRPTTADSIHEIGNGSITLVNCSSGLSKQNTGQYMHAAAERVTPFCFT